MSNTIKLKLPKDYADRVLMIVDYRTWLNTKGISFSFVIEDEQHLPTLININDEVDATAFKLKFGL